MSAPILRQTTPADYTALMTFLGRTLQVDTRPAAAFGRLDLAAWKYWDEHPSWDGARSFVLERTGTIIAHGAVWPLTIVGPGTRIPAVQLYDWAADPAAVGAGLSLLRQVARRGGVICSIGGTKMTQRMRKPMGFQERNVVRSCVRVLRPAREALAAPWSWRTVPRLARTALRAFPLPRPGHGWQAQLASPEDLAAPDVPYPEPNGRRLVFEQDAARLAFLLRCPTTRLRCWIVRRHGRPAGYFVLRLGAADAQVVDAWAEAADDPAAWRAVYALAVQEARRVTPAARLSTYAPHPVPEGGLVAAGFRVTYEQPVHVYDPHGRVAPDAQLCLQLAHTDYAFL